jgi:hypothetical protein
MIDFWRGPRKGKVRIIRKEIDNYANCAMALLPLTPARGDRAMVTNKRSLIDIMFKMICEEKNKNNRHND